MKKRWMNDLFMTAMTLTLICMVTPIPAQTPPTDLTELDLEDILALRIKRESVDRWSISYRYTHVKFKGNRDGTENLSTADVLWNTGPEDRTTKNFPVVPEVIMQDAHMVQSG